MDTEIVPVGDTVGYGVMPNDDTLIGMYLSPSGMGLRLKGPQETSHNVVPHPLNRNRKKILIIALVILPYL